MKIARVKSVNLLQESACQIWFKDQIESWKLGGTAKSVLKCLFVPSMREIPCLGFFILLSIRDVKLNAQNFEIFGKK